MIRRFSVITSVGKFKAFRADSALLDLSSRSVLFGSNGHGKSTLTTILRSLSLCDEDGADYLRGKRTLGSDKPVNVVIDWDAQAKSIFQGDRWVKTLPPGTKLHIYDSDYVKDNLFTETVTAEHRRQICTIVLGKQGQELANTLNLSLEARKALAKSLKTMNNELAGRQARIGPRHKYLDIPEKCLLADVSKRLEQIEKEIANKASEESIRKRSRLRGLSFVPPAVTLWREQASINVGSSHHAAQEMVRQHITKYFEQPSTGQNFAFTGMQAAKDTCPFCGQDLAPAEALMEAYRNAFDQAYSNAKTSVAKLWDSIQAWSPTGFVAELAKAHADAALVAEDWSGIFKPKQKLSSLPEWWQSVAPALQASHRALVDQIMRKKDALETQVDNAIFESVQEQLERLREWVASTNNEIQSLNSEIEEFVRSLGETTIGTLQERRGIAKAYEQRFSPTEMKWCDQYRELKDQEKRLDDAVESADKALRDYSSATFDKYQRSINATLTNLGCAFSLKELRPAELKGSIKSIPATLVLEIDSHAVSADVQDRKKPNFRNTLSEGDKNCLALAFFLAGLDQESDLENAILVFDDPVTSLDCDRRMMLVQEIERRAKRASQCLILTHNTDFLKVLATYDWFCPEKNEDARYFRVSASNVQGSSITSLHLDEYLREEHSRRVERLMEWLRTGVLPSNSEVYKDARKSLEYAIDVKWGHRLGKAMNLGQQVRSLKGQNLLPTQELDELEYIHRATSSDLHANQRFHVMRDANQGEVINLIERGINVMEKI